MVIRLRAGRPGFDFWQGLGLLSLRHRVQTGSGAQPASYLMGTGGSPPSSTEIKNMWKYTSTLKYVFMALYLVKHMHFTFYIYNLEMFIFHVRALRKWTL
jgi:hypothetical protein